MENTIPAIIVVLICRFKTSIFFAPYWVPIKMEAPIHVSNLNLLDPKSGKPTRVGRRKNEEGKTVRYSKKSGEEIK